MEISIVTGKLANYSSQQGKISGADGTKITRSCNDVIELSNSGYPRLHGLVSRDTGVSRTADFEGDKCRDDLQVVLDSLRQFGREHVTVSIEQDFVRGVLKGDQQSGDVIAGTKHLSRIYLEHASAQTGEVILEQEVIHGLFIGHHSVKQLL